MIETIKEISGFCKMYSGINIEQQQLIYLIERLKNKATRMFWEKLHTQKN